MVIDRNVELDSVDEADFIVEHGATLTHRGIIEGDVDVRRGSFILRGILKGRLKVSAEGSASIYGTAHLSEVVACGPVNVYGIVKAPSDNGLVPREGCIINGARH